jgi:hypothetical protein
MNAIHLDRQQRLMLILMIGGAAVLATVATWLQPPVVAALRIVAAFCLVYAAAAVLSRLPDRYGAARGRAWVREHVGDLGAGFYGVMGLAVFLLLELRTLFEDLSGPNPIRNFLSEFGLNWLIGFSLASFQNFIQALIWPANLLNELGARGTLVVAGTCWGILWVASRILPAECLDSTDTEAVDASESELS